MGRREVRQPGIQCSLAPQQPASLRISVTYSCCPSCCPARSTGKGLELVRLFYNLLPQRHRWAEKQGDLAEFVVDETFSVPGVGTVVAGTVKKGVIVPNTTLLMGEWVQHARAEEGQRVGLLPSSLCPP